MYRVFDMWLGFELEVQEEARFQPALRAFHDIWPRYSEPCWQYMLGPIDEGQFIDQANQEFRDRIACVSPYPDKTGWDFDLPVNAIGWRVGPHGLHEWVTKLNFTTSTRPHGPWTFEFPFNGGTGRATVLLHLNWRMARTLTLPPDCCSEAAEEVPPSRTQSSRNA